MLWKNIRTYLSEEFSSSESFKYVLVDPHSNVIMVRIVGTVNFVVQFRDFIKASRVAAKKLPDVKISTSTRLQFLCALYGGKSYSAGFAPRKYCAVKRSCSPDVLLRFQTIFERHRTTPAVILMEP